MARKVQAPVVGAGECPDWVLFSFRRLTASLQHWLRNSSKKVYSQGSLKYWMQLG